MKMWVCLNTEDTVSFAEIAHRAARNEHILAVAREHGFEPEYHGTEEGQIEYAIELKGSAKKLAAFFNHLNSLNLVGLTVDYLLASEGEKTEAIADHYEGALFADFYFNP